ncbi:hypothetical protein [Cellvibrio sp. QJXJ]|uniref:hypothetical protein n=1 Tax=Cellvibrio sp. QJXJ TaxID=2964606 RepID=UPI0021C2AB2E|nr:hypothetical protein [Cellvibrio sp. QJXJ]UUA73412.1 hypothetical protein NNX04_02925 [Cellvibrio sp. QJXJ]
MYKEVSFDPSCMGSMEYYGLLKQHFGHDHGRYISADVKAWAKEAMQYVKQSALQPVKQKSIKNYLNKLVISRNHDEFHLASDRRGIDHDIWINWHNLQISVRPFSFAVSESQAINCIGIDHINDGCDVWNLSRSISVDRNAVAIIDALMPLIEISNTITIIDQFFRLTKNDTISQLFTRLENSQITSIRVVTSMDSPNALQIYTREYQPENVKGISLSWIKAPDKFFHDRYFITDVGAVRSGHGFMPEVQKGIHADKANLNIIGKEEAGRTLSDLDALFERQQAVEIFRI